MNNTVNGNNNELDDLLNQLDEEANKGKTPKDKASSPSLQKAGSLHQAKPFTTSESLKKPQKTGLPGAPHRNEQMFNSPYTLSDDGFTVDTPREEIELLTPLEKGMLLFLGISVAAVAALLLIEEAVPLWIFIVTVVICFGILFVLLTTKHFYILDFEHQHIVSHLEILGSTSEKPLLPFAEVAAATITGAERVTRQRRWWDYKAVLITDSGKVIPVSDYARNLEGLNHSRKIARNIALRIKTEFVPGEEKMAVSVRKKHTSGVDISHRTPTLGMAWLYFIIFLIIAILFAIFREQIVQFII